MKESGCLFSANGCLKKNIRKRIGMDKISFNEMQTAFTGGLKQGLTKQVFKTLVWNVKMYESET